MDEEHFVMYLELMSQCSPVKYCKIDRGLYVCGIIKHEEVSKKEIFKFKRLPFFLLFVFSADKPGGGGGGKRKHLLTLYAAATVLRRTCPVQINMVTNL